MIAFKNVSDILAKSLEWEQKLKDLYDVAEFAIRGDQTRTVIGALRDNLVKKLAVLRNVRTADHGSAEWVRYAADFHDEELLAKDTISRDSSPDEILSHIVNYQTHLRDFYALIADKLVSRDQKELFESLASFKQEQIGESQRLATNVR